MLGIALAVVLRQVGRDVKLSKGVAVIGWASSLALILWCFYSPINLTHRDYIYEPSEVANYAAWAPLLWSMSISWIISVCYIGAGGEYESDFR